MDEKNSTIARSFPEACGHTRSKHFVALATGPASAILDQMERPQPSTVSCGAEGLMCVITFFLLCCFAVFICLVKNEIAAQRQGKSAMQKKSMGPLFWMCAICLLLIAASLVLAAAL